MGFIYNFKVYGEDFDVLIFVGFFTAAVENVIQIEKL
jgi:hypothetical protein